MTLRAATNRYRVQRAQMAAAMTEDELLSAITTLATYTGWRWHHIRRSDKAVQMGHSGFPDLVLSRRGRTLLLELKSGKGQPTPDQLAWLAAVNGNTAPERRRARSVEARLVYPADLDGLLTELADDE